MVEKTETNGRPLTDEVLKRNPSQEAIENLGDDFADSKPKKKRRIIKTTDKKFECPEDGCGKSYSRAEHLYRHQLNHTPKQIYYCDFPGCDRHFVRADLCARHKERHTAKGSTLQRKDAFANAQRAELQSSDPTSPSGPTTVGASPENATHHQPSQQHQQQQHRQQYALTDQYNQEQAAAAPQQSYAPAVQSQHQQHDVYASHTNGHPQSAHVNGQMHLDPQLTASMNGAAHTYANANLAYPAQSMLPPTSTERRMMNNDVYITSNNSNGSNTRAASQQFAAPLTNGNAAHQSLTSPTPPPPTAQSGSSSQSAQHVPPMYQTQPYPSPSPTSFRSPTAYASLPPLPPFGTPNNLYGATNLSRPGVVLSPSAYMAQDQHPVPNSGPSSIADFNTIEQINNGLTMPVFGNDYIGFTRSPPLVLNEDWFTALLGSNADHMLDLQESSPSNQDPSITEPLSMNTPLPKLEHDGTPVVEGPAPSIADGLGALLAHGLDISLRESIVSNEKRLRLIELIRKRFTDSEELSGTVSVDKVLDNFDADSNHPLSLQMLKVYLASFWVHIHQQMPILHRPTFNSETCPDLLLLAMMCLGASCLERTHSTEQTRHCAEVSIFLAYHIRWEVFKDPEFRPTAKLWTFQTMLLLELFEKMFSTKTLHERAHIHHATTLIVMRRGSSLIGRAYESSATSNDPTRTPPGPDGTINTSGQNTPDATWNRWITAEATRRAAFAAFIIDSTHATLFGHSAVMSPHDLKLPLPCDEALWAATSMAEVQRVEASLAANGFKPTTFVEGLKRTLAGQKVRTNTFGRQILMAGLLNVSWHMNQRDLQVNSLGVGNTLGTQFKWRANLTRAFDFWRRDFDESLSKNEHWLQMCNPKISTDRNSADFRDNVFESRTCLHSLAHMAMHVDMVDCVVFAGSERVLGRIVTDQDRTAVQRRMREQWAPSARARDAVFYALRFLCEVLIPDEDFSTHRRNPSQPPVFAYSARDDYLLNRPWVLYFAALIVWSYGYALDGPIRPASLTLTSRDLQIFDMQRYLIRMGRVAAPDDLEKLKDRSSCLGLLMLLRQCFKQPRWELLREAGDLLGNCIELLLPGNTEIKSYM